MTQSRDRSPLAPPQNRKQGNGVFKFSPVQKADEAAFVVLCPLTLDGISPLSIITWVITANAAFTVEVETPLTDTYASLPDLVDADPFESGQIAIIKGKWPSIKVTTTGAVHVMAHPDPYQWF